MSGIYIVKAEGAEDRYVDAASKTDAFVHVASEFFDVKLLSNAELRAAMKAGVSVESTEKAGKKDKEQPASATQAPVKED